MDAVAVASYAKTFNEVNTALNRALPPGSWAARNDATSMQIGVALHQQRLPLCCEIRAQYGRFWKVEGEVTVWPANAPLGSRQSLTGNRQSAIWNLGAAEDNDGNNALCRANLKNNAFC